MSAQVRARRFLLTPDCCVVNGKWFDRWSPFSLSFSGRAHLNDVLFAILARKRAFSTRFFSSQMSARTHQCSPNKVGLWRKLAWIITQMLCNVKFTRKRVVGIFFISYKGGDSNPHCEGGPFQITVKNVN